ncbi:hypothetical protein [Pseudoxanthomonas indica]|uniref:Adhesin n=1 Tax=Pseudoxanthomonas indica TaxID=428993 RepID=A0A1T5IP00_9GAMM|nr:hypothetical protein [Pseudoxanthomonas indica]GGD53317.1 hypothetical protein GCM10007235_26950 [Pseudoxanthomonas indica]SKC40748.1 hypothetical protein SAMN06296058_0112 [Pseudoxanthomonas indica]
MLSRKKFVTLASLGLLSPLTALATQPCANSAPRTLALDLAGVKAVVFEVESHDLRLNASAGAKGQITGRACAYDAKALEELTVTQARQGDKLLVKLHRAGPTFKLFGDHYAYLDVTGSLPDNLPVQLIVGSGDAEISGAAIVSADVGSGDARVRNTRGLVAAEVGSGDIEVDDAGSLKVITIGSGDIESHGIRGSVDVGDIGSGDFDLERGTGDVRIKSIGSGNATLSGVGGQVWVGSIGSGDVDVRDVRGGLKVDKIGSGGVRHTGVAGEVSLPKNHQGD